MPTPLDRARALLEELEAAWKAECDGKNHDFTLVEKVVSTSKVLCEVRERIIGASQYDVEDWEGHYARYRAAACADLAHLERAALIDWIATNSPLPDGVIT